MPLAGAGWAGCRGTGEQQGLSFEKVRNTSLPELHQMAPSRSRAAGPQSGRHAAHLGGGEAGGGEGDSGGGGLRQGGSGARARVRVRTLPGAQRSTSKLL